MPDPETRTVTPTAKRREGQQGERDAAPGSPLADLRARYARHLENLHLDMKVPRVDDDGGPSIWVRYNPVDPGLVADINASRDERRRKDGHDWWTDANADILISAVVGVYAKDGTGPDAPVYSLRPDDPTGPWTKFDPDLAESLGIDTTRARDVVKRLYLTKGDLVGAAIRLCEWSGSASVTADEEFLGN